MLTHARIAAVGVLMAAGSASGQLESRLGWSHIGDTGNAPVPASLSQQWNERGLGRVDHEYWITTTEVTTEVWFDFVLAWSPYHQSHFTTGRFSSALMGTSGIKYDPFAEVYFIEPGFERHPVDISWRLAAVFANWLHNDQGSDEADFLSGAYDISTFGGDPPVYTDQFEPSPGAKFWIPTMGEWVKAMHYDPNRFGAGEGGYWLYPHGKDTRPIPGPPGIGETDQDWGAFNQSREVGLYADEMSPYGLLDGSGGAAEWAVEQFNGRAYYRQSRTGGNGSLDASHIVFGAGSRGVGAELGFRLATNIPAPPGAAFFAIAVAYVGRRHR